MKVGLCALFSATPFSDYPRLPHAQRRRRQSHQRSRSARHRGDARWRPWAGGSEDAGAPSSWRSLSASPASSSAAPSSSRRCRRTGRAQRRSNTKSSRPSLLTPLGSPERRRHSGRNLPGSRPGANLRHPGIYDRRSSCASAILYSMLTWRATDASQAEKSCHRYSNAYSADTRTYPLGRRLVVFDFKRHQLRHLHDRAEARQYLAARPAPTCAATAQFRLGLHPNDRWSLR